MYDGTKPMTGRELASAFQLGENAIVPVFRPIETWTEGGRRRSRVDYRNVRYGPAQEVVIANTLDWLLASSHKDRTSLFFGVCPRLGKKGRFDLAWQIRTVRCLWADIDDCTVDDAIARCQQ